jgi:hypothetical protein
VTDQPAPGSAWSSSRGADDEGWGPATPVRAGARRGAQAPPRGALKPPKRAADDGADGWNAAGPLPRRRQSDGRSAAASYPWAPPRAKERGLPWWGALLVLLGIAAIGGLIDTIGSSQTRGGFNIGIVVASVVAILVVRRSHMFPIVIAPPIVYSGAAVFDLYLRSGGLHNKRVVFDAAANYLVYGFPAIASATAAVLIIAGIRLIARR